MLLVRSLTKELFGLWGEEALSLKIFIYMYSHTGRMPIYLILKGKKLLIKGAVYRAIRVQNAYNL